jgi:hypothetical protein
MRIDIKTTDTQAIKYGRNTCTWTTDVDVSTLTPDQRNMLVNTNFWEHKLIDLLDGSGEITAASIQAEIDRQAAEQAEQAAIKARKAAEIAADRERHEALVVAYENGGDWDADAYDHLSYQYRESEDSRALGIRYRAEKTRRAAAWDRQMLPDVVAYENGGDRPGWSGSWGGSDDLLERIIDEDRRIEARKKEVLEQTLVDWANEHGSERLQLAIKTGCEFKSDARLEYVRSVLGNEYNRYTGSHFPGEEKTCLHPEIELLREVDRVQNLSISGLSASVELIVPYDDEPYQIVRVEIPALDGCNVVVAAKM